jgi:hypothetical protein
VIREAKRYKADLPVIIITGFPRVERDRSGQPRRRRLSTKPFRVPQVSRAAKPR